MYYGQPFLEISVPKEGKKVVGDVRYHKHGEAGADAALDLNSAFTVVELLRNGVTTFVEFGSQLSVQDGLLAGGHSARHARLSRARLRLRPLGRRREGQAQARPQ